MSPIQLLLQVAKDVVEPNAHNNSAIAKQLKIFFIIFLLKRLKYDFNSDLKCCLIGNRIRLIIIAEAISVCIYKVVHSHGMICSPGLETVIYAIFIFIHKWTYPKSLERVGILYEVADAMIADFAIFLISMMSSPVPEKLSLGC